MGLTFNLGRVSPSVFTDASLNVGIGAAPSGTYKLEVTGTAKVSSTLLVSGAATFSSSVTAGGKITATGGNYIYALEANAGTTSGQSYGLKVTGGTTSTDDAMVVYNAAASSTLFRIAGTGAATFSSSVTATQGLFNSTSAGTYPIIASNSGGYTTLGLYNTYSSTSNRNWALVTNNSNTGDFGIVQSNAQNGDPVAAGTTRFSISPTGNVGIGAADSIVKLNIVGAGATSATYCLYMTNSAPTSLFSVRNDGAIYTGTAANSPYNLTTGSGANVFVESGGLLYRSTSSLKYKKEVRDYDKGLEEVMSMRAVYYKGKSENDGDKQFAGLIAEEIHELGLTEFVQYAEDGTPDALSYSNMIALLTKAIQEQQATITSLQDRITKAGL